jgi:hypothetical protein
MQPGQVVEQVKNSGLRDRIIMEYDPHQLIEGMILSAFAIESELAFIYIRGEYYFAAASRIVRSSRKGNLFLCASMSWVGRSLRHLKQSSVLLRTRVRRHFLRHLLC